VERYERELADYFEIEHAVAVSSGTAALHCAVHALEIGPGDEVLVPAVSVVMSVAPVLYAGAVPVFVDCGPDGAGVDLHDLEAKITERTRAVMAVHLWGRTGDLLGLVECARTNGLRVIEDACQAVGSRVDGQLAGTFGDLGCLSTKDGKILWSGEGGAVLTRHQDLADDCRAFRTHWQAPPAGQAPHAKLGHNYRLAEPLAALARTNLARLDDLLAVRRHQSWLLTSLLSDALGIGLIRQDWDEEWNWHSPVLRLGLSRSREFTTHLSGLGVPNSVGTFGLISAEQRPVFADYARGPCLRARAVLDSTLAVVIGEQDADDRIRVFAATITEEAARWANR
jgi:perosamine synthetase